MLRTEISAPKAAMASKEKLIREMYISNVSKRLRDLNQPTDNDRKRWIWELIQNAKDTIANDLTRDTVNIRIEIEGNTVRFRHDGKPFTMDARFALLWKYSEDKENQESTGRFGTGFLTTHCLSKIVGIESDVYDGQNIRGFSVTMYRDGQTKAELLEGLNKMEASEKWYEQPFGSTTFTYNVNSESGRQAITLGIKSFNENIVRTMLFCKELGSVELIEDGVITSVERLGETELGNGIRKSRFSIIRNGVSDEKDFLICSLKEDNEVLSARYKAPRKIRIDAALEIGSNNSIAGADNKLMYFCSLPLVGVENQLDAPIIINSPDFEPDTERQSLLLNGISWNEEINIITEIGINQLILKKTIAMYESLVSYASSMGYGSQYLLARGLKSLKEHDKLDKKWYEENILKEYRITLSRYEVVTPAHGAGTKKIGDCIFIKESNLEKENEVLAFASVTHPDKVVCENHEWSSQMWDDTVALWNLDSYCNSISSYGNWAKLDIEEDKRSSWYNCFLSYVKTADENLLNGYALIPDWNGNFKKKNTKDFKQGENLSEFVINLLSNFGIDKKSELMHSKITAVSLESKYNSISFSADIDKAIKSITDNSFKSGYDKQVQLMKLLVITPDNVEKYGDNFITFRKNILQIMSDFFSISDVEPIIDNSLNKKAWESADKWIRTYFLKSLEKRKRLTEMPEGLGSAWISDAMRNIEATTYEMDSYAVLPNQNGTFQKHSCLYADGGIPECLKSDTLKKIYVDYKSCLLDKDINCDSVKISKSKKMSDIVSDIRNRYISTSNCGWYSCDEWFDGSYHKYRRNIIEEVALYMCSILPAKNEDTGDTPDWILKQYELQKVARAVIPDTSFEDNSPIDYDQDNLWSRTNKYALGAITRKIESLGNLSGLSEHMNVCDENKALEILNLFHKCGGSGKTFPNQDGSFFEITDLKKDDGTISDEIKDIIELISEEGKSFRDILVDRRCGKQPESTLGSADAYKYIDDTVDAKFKVSDNWTDDNFKNAVQLLVEDWAENHASIWNTDNFPKIYSKKDSLLMNVVWTKEERQSIQRMKTALTAESIDFIIENVDIIKSYPAKVKKLEDEISRLRKQLGYVEDDTTVGAEAAGGLTGKEIEKLNLEAKQCVKEIMEKEGFVFTDGIGQYSVIDGVDKDNVEYPLVVKSCMNRDKRIYMNPSEWEQLCKKNSMLWLYFGNGVAKPVKAYDLFTYHDKLSLSFGTMNFRDTAKVSTLMNAFKYLGDVHLNLEAMNPFTETRAELESYLFNSSNALSSNTESESDDILPK